MSGSEEAREGVYTSDLLSACRRISSERELDSLLTRLAEEASRLTHSDRASIFLYDRERCELWSKVALGTEKELRLDARLGIAGEVALQGDPIVVRDAYDDPRFNPAVDRKLGYETRNIAAMPMKNEQGETVGVFQVLNRKEGHFTKEDLGLLEELASHAAVALETALLVGRLREDREELKAENRQLRAGFEKRPSTTLILGTSAPTQELVRQIGELASSPVDVLVTGESGTGKELVARSIHDLSGREGRFVALNCSALPEGLVEAELFGIADRVATGVERRQGRFLQADGGTLFLDEIADLALSSQAKILRVLQERVVEPVGETEPRPLDVRIVAATNKSLEDEIKAGRFREDLYYRIRVIHLRTPSLREIREDIPLLAEHFLGRYCRMMDRPEKELSEEALSALKACDWPGNVRELENEMKRIAVTVRRKVVRPQDLGDAFGTKAKSSRQTSLKTAVADLEKKMIREALEACGNNRVRAARMLGLSRQGLLNKIERYDLS